MNRSEKLLNRFKALDAGVVGHNAAYQELQEPLDAKLKVFICHASEDKPRARELYRQLVQDDYDVWLDEQKLLPGQDWQFEIRKAVRNSDIFVVLLIPQGCEQDRLRPEGDRPSFGLRSRATRGDDLCHSSKTGGWPYPTTLESPSLGEPFDDDGHQKLLRALRKRVEDLAT